MLKVLLVCTSGISTTLLIKKIEEAAKKKHINAYIWATSESDMKSQVPQADIVLLGPQSRYLQSSVEEMVKRQPVVPINLMAYGKMDGEAVFKMVMEYFKVEL